MAKQLYGYSSTYGAAGAGGGSGTPTSSATAALSSVYTSRSLADPYHLSDSALRYDPDHSKYSSSSLYDTLRYSGAATSPYLSSQQTWPPGVDPTDHLTAGIKRHSEGCFFLKKFLISYFFFNSFRYCAAFLLITELNEVISLVTLFCYSILVSKYIFIIIIEKNIWLLVGSFQFL